MAQRYTVGHSRATCFVDSKQTYPACRRSVYRSHSVMPRSPDPEMRTRRLVHADRATLAGSGTTEVVSLERRCHAAASVVAKLSHAQQEVPLTRRYGSAGLAGSILSAARWDRDPSDEPRRPALACTRAGRQVQPRSRAPREMHVTHMWPKQGVACTGGSSGAGPASEGKNHVREPPVSLTTAAGVGRI